MLGERVKTVVQHSRRFVDEETEEGYRPCDPAIVVERVQQLEVSGGHQRSRGSHLGHPGNAPSSSWFWVTEGSAGY